jgi:glycosyltransferase involved in cell wall biosynthesis
MLPQVSILIPCYNADRWIAQAIDSALAQTYPHKEVIVVDDGSTDRSLEIIQGFGDRIRWETGENRGGNAARNRLLELSTGEWLQYLDADDYLLPDKVERQIQFWQGSTLAGTNADVIYSPHITEESAHPSVVHTAAAIAHHPLPHDLWLLVIQWQLPQTGSLLLRKQALIDIEGWREALKHCQDYDLYIRLLMANQQFVYCPYAGAVYRWWCSGTVTHRKIAEIYRDRLGIQTAIESYLSASGQLSPVRKDALNQARFEYARRIYAWDQSWAIQVAAEIRDNHPDFEPAPQVAPSFYRQIYKTIGFRSAEQIAALKRRIVQ